MKNLTWQNPEQLFVAQVLINKVKSKCCGIKDIYVYYTDSKIVYRAKAVYSEQDEDLVDSYYKEVKDMLDTKYALEESENETSDGYPSHRIYVTDETDSRSLGQIVLYKSKFNGDYGYVSYSIHVVYYDDSNQIKHQNDNLDDL